jgi:hypothetical protein
MSSSAVIDGVAALGLGHHRVKWPSCREGIDLPTVRFSGALSC